MLQKYQCAYIPEGESNIWEQSHDPSTFLLLRYSEPSFKSCHVGKMFVHKTLRWEPELESGALAEKHIPSPACSYGVLINIWLDRKSAAVEIKPPFCGRRQAAMMGAAEEADTWAPYQFPARMSFLIRDIAQDLNLWR